MSLFVLCAVLFCIELLGIVWYGVVWYGMYCKIRYGMLLTGVVTWAKDALRDSYPEDAHNQDTRIVLFSLCSSGSTKSLNISFWEMRNQYSKQTHLSSMSVRNEYPKEVFFLITLFFEINSTNSWGSCRKI